MNWSDFLDTIKADIKNGKVHNKLTLEKLAASYSITDKNLVKELTELAIVMLARQYARHTSLSIVERFHQIVKLYEKQPNLSHRTSNSIKLQQYSTPAPIAFLAGIFAGIHEADSQSLFFEPSAGNGLLTIAGDPKLFIVNEIDKIRLGHLREQDFHAVTSMDGSKPFTRYQKSFDAVLTNPPFEKLAEPVEVDGYPIQALEHLMAIHALDTMLNEGKAAIIIGGHTSWDDKGRIQAGKNRIFFNYLYNRYHVKDVINIDGKLYARQGTAFDVRLILIDGRKDEPEGAAPLFDEYSDAVIYTFHDLYDRVIRYVKDNDPPNYKHDTKMKLNETKSWAGYLFSIGDKISFIGTGGKVFNGIISLFHIPRQYEVKIGKRLAYLEDDRVVPQIVSAKKYKESYGSGYKVFDKLKPAADDRYRVDFLDGKSLDNIKADDRNEAMSQAIEYYLEKRRHEKEYSAPLVSPTPADPDIELLALAAKAKLLLLRSRKKTRPS